MSKPRLFPCLIIATVLLALAGSVAGGENKITTPQQVWADFDPAAEPLEVEVTRIWREDNLEFRELRFTGMTQGDSKVHVYALYAAPAAGQQLPAVLHIHGGGQTASPEWLRFWGRRGYAALAFDFCGKWPGREKFTDWGELTQGNMAMPGDKLMAIEPSPRESSWYLWARVSRRALTALAAQDEVDRERLGIFGISVGGSLVWPVAATDSRVKAACAIYGVGYTTYPVDFSEADPQASDPKTKLWRATMEPESYAPLVRCPLLFLNSTNDHHGRMDPSFLTLEVTADCRWAYTPRYRHHILWDQGQDLSLWMDTHLLQKPAWPRSPAAKVQLSNTGVPQLAVTPDRPAHVERLEIFYAIENTNPINRFWRSATVAHSGDHWTADLPILDIHQPLFAFANVHYQSGVCLSTRLQSSIPAKLGSAVATDRPSLLIDDFSTGIGGWVTTSTATDPIPPVPALLKAATGPGDLPGVTVSHPITLLTHKIGDPKWRGPEGASLELKVFATAAKDLRLTIKEREMSPGQRAYVAARQLEPAADWQLLRLSVADFRDEKGESPQSWQASQCLELATTPSTGPEPVYSAFRWAD
jgi:dienelactone hydrolase